MKPFILTLRIVALVAALIHLYNVFTKDPIPKWSYLLFAITMLTMMFLSLSKHLNQQK